MSQELSQTQDKLAQRFGWRTWYNSSVKKFRDLHVPGCAGESGKRRDGHRAMKPENRLDIAKRLVREAEGLVARQQELLAALDSKGYRREPAQQLLGNLEDALMNFRGTLARLQASQF